MIALVTIVESKDIAMIAMNKMFARVTEGTRGRMTETLEIGTETVMTAEIGMIGDTIEGMIEKVTEGMIEETIAEVREGMIAHADPLGPTRVISTPLMMAKNLHGKFQTSLSTDLVKVEDG